MELKPEQLAALEALFAAEIASALEGKPVLPEPEKTPRKVMRSLIAAGLAESVSVMIPAPPGDRFGPVRVSTWFLTHPGRYAYCNSVHADIEEDLEVAKP